MSSLIRTIYRRHPHASETISPAEEQCPKHILWIKPPLELHQPPILSPVNLSRLTVSSAMSGKNAPSIAPSAALISLPKPSAQVLLSSPPPGSLAVPTISRIPCSSLFRKRSHAVLLLVEHPWRTCMAARVAVGGIEAPYFAITSMVDFESWILRVVAHWTFPG